MKPKVLMLGWEFPPMITGGLGKACEGLFRALNPYTELTLVLPRASPELSAQYPQVLGLSQQIPADLQIVAQPALRRIFVAAPEPAPETAPADAPVVAADSPAGALPAPAPDYAEFKEVVLVETDLSPYPIPVVKVVRHLPSLSPLPVFATVPPSAVPPADLGSPQLAPAPTPLDAAAIRDLYADADNYGPRTLEKVTAYTEMVKRLAATRSFDLIHAHDWLTMRAGVELKRLTGKPLVVHVHSLETDRVGPGQGRKAHNEVYKMEYEGMLNADLVVPVSQYTKKQILEHYPGIEPGKIVPVYNAIDAPTDLDLPDFPDGEVPPVIDEETGEPKPVPQVAHHKVVLFMGRITYQKGPEFLLQTAQKLIAQDPKVVFAVAGAGEMQGWLQQQVNERRLGANFIFLGHLNAQRLTELMQRASVYFMPSISEPFGLAALEAGQAGLPSVLSRQSGASEVLDQGVLTADCWDIDKFANYIHALLNYQALRQVLVAENRAAVATLSWDKAARQVLDLYQQLLPSPALV
ncbi:MAG: glycosyltransferase family 4 protein [Bernardetiaceae bacterium]|nr:glycosyltransferase family 4 protein [Bernardetiaceae bacterium]